MLPIAALTVVCILTYTFEIIFGLAGTIMMLMVMTFFFDTKTLVIYSVMPQILVATIGLLRSPKTVNVFFIIKMLAFALIGFVCGLYLFYIIAADLFHTLLASAITLFGLYLVYSPGKLKLNALTSRMLDILAGMSQALFGISGPIAMTRLLSTFDNKTVVRNYALAFFLTLNLARAGGYLMHQTITVDIGKMMLVSGPPLALALWFSNHLHFKVNENLFRRVVAWIILLGGVVMLFD